MKWLIIEYSELPPMSRPAPQHVEAPAGAVKGTWYVGTPEASSKQQIVTTSVVSL
jgi:hypothetical protein